MDPAEDTLESQHLKLAIEYIHSQDYTSPTRLTGGTANFVFRVHSSHSPSKTAILKHAAPFIASLPSVPFPIDRMSFEVAILNLLSKQPLSLTSADQSSSVSTPTVYAHDTIHHHVLMSDAGTTSTTLKAIYPALSPTQLSSIGARLGTWLASLHSLDLTTSRSTLDNKSGKAMSRFATYGRLAAEAARRNASISPTETSFWNRIDQEYGAALIADDACICHGDFWPGNVLVQADSSSSTNLDAATTTATTTTPPLTVVDWELVRLGSGATDVGQFAAEAYLLDHFHPTTTPTPNTDPHTLLSTFLHTYHSTAPRSTHTQEWQQKTLVHFGVHLWFWTAVAGWGDGAAETERVVRYGREMVELALDGSVQGRERWADTVLGQLFGRMGGG